MGDTLILAVGLDEYRCASLAFSPDGALLAAGRSNGMTAIWHVQTGRLVRNVLHDLLGRPVCAVAFSPDGTHLATAGGGHVALRDLRTGRLVWKRQHPAELTAVTVGPDGVTTACADGALRTWTLHGRLTGSARGAEAGGGGAVVRAETADGRLVATVEGDELRVWATSPAA